MKDYKQPKDYTFEPSLPNRIWLKDFSSKPEWGKIIFWFVVVMGLFILLVWQSNEAWYKHERALCMTFKYPSDWDKDYCLQFGVTYKIIK